ncbi:hypothetical protein AVEN_245330-1 [Araneus ventricosus]|uniref:Uncharacterized protein n=1 Tax=Araneus ventricosus TaxID=182803 RepID=A0A4Y2TPM8_ARAVE|nr:hypothetical protein AVEN_245330-1 [Araneus ventricosus]
MHILMITHSPHCSSPQSSYPTLLLPTILLSHNPPFPQFSSSPSQLISDFLSSSRGPNLGRTVVFRLASQRGPQKAIRLLQSDFKLFGIPTLPFRYANFHRVFTLTKAFLSRVPNIPVWNSGECPASTDRLSLPIWRRTFSPVFCIS